MKIKVEGKILSIKQKDNKRYMIISQLNKNGFQELLKVNLKNSNGYKVGDDVVLDVNIRAILTQDKKAILTSWED